MTRQHGPRQLQHPATYSPDLVTVGRDGHPIASWQGAGRGEPTHPFHLYQASATSADGLHVGVLAKLRDVGPGGVDCVQHRRAVGHLDGSIVDG